LSLHGFSDWRASFNLQKIQLQLDLHIYIVNMHIHYTHVHIYIYHKTSRFQHSIAWLCVTAMKTMKGPISSALLRGCLRSFVTCASSLVFVLGFWPSLTREGRRLEEVRHGETEDSWRWHQFPSFLAGSNF
jgi:hypothetical protein